MCTSPNSCFLGPTRVEIPNGIWISSAVFFTAHRTYNGPPFPPQNCPFPRGDLDTHLIHDSMGPSKPATQTASRSVQPFLQGSLLWQTDRQTDDATRSVATGRIYVRSRLLRCGLRTISTEIQSKCNVSVHEGSLEGILDCKRWSCSITVLHNQWFHRSIWCAFSATAESLVSTVSWCLSVHV